MFKPDRDDDVICALATPSGPAGIGVIRVSGAGSVEIVRKICEFLPKEPRSHTVYYGYLIEPRDEKQSGFHVGAPAAPVDEVLVTFFEGGRSFTGEETVEISCHGNPIILNEALRCLSVAGARPADRGEFTYRAFLNGRIDLVQAESVLALIEGTSKRATRLALGQLKGELSQKFLEIQDRVVGVLAYIEADIDFSTEGLDVLERTKVLRQIDEILGLCDQLTASYREGRRVREGIRVAIMGRPNVGKSSLLNALVGEDRAIVTPIAGTTRDTIEGEVLVNGLRVTLVDTAGLRETSDLVEKMGVERSRAAGEGADAVLYVFDASAGLVSEELSNINRIKSDLILVGNKVDQGKRDANNVSFGPELIWTSTVSGEGLDVLRRMLRSRFSPDVQDSSAVVSQARHFDLLSKCLDSLKSAGEGWKSGLGSELVAVDLRSALRAINEVLGNEFDDHVIDRIFKDFCIGK